MIRWPHRLGSARLGRVESQLGAQRLTAKLSIGTAHENVIDAPRRFARFCGIVVRAVVGVAGALTREPPSVREIHRLLLQSAQSGQEANCVRVRSRIEITHQHGRQLGPTDRRELRHALGNEHDLALPNRPLMKLPVQVRDEYRQTSMRGLALRIEQRASLTALAAGELKALLRNDRIAREDRIAELQAIAIVARYPVRELVAETVRDLRQLIVVHRERSLGGRVGPESQHLLQANDLRLQSLELSTNQR